jgi:hypothetical protein
VFRPSPWRSSRRLGCLALLALLLFVGLGLPAPAHAVPTHAATTSYPPIVETTTGPTVVGKTLQATYTVTGSGGPAEAANGTMVGNITYNATLSALNGQNISAASINPTPGVLINGSVILRFTAPNVTGKVRLEIELTSTYNTTNATKYFNSTIQVVPPYILSGLLVAGPTTVTGFNMTVTVDGTAVGHVVIPTIVANGSYRFTYDYVPESLGAGYHTISVSLAPEHGLVTFQGGVEQISLQFYVAGPPPDYALDVGIGIAAFAVAVFIWGSVVGARRRGRRAR